GGEARRRTPRDVKLPCRKEALRAPAHSTSFAGASRRFSTYPVRGDCAAAWARPAMGTGQRRPRGTRRKEGFQAPGNGKAIAIRPMQTAETGSTAINQPADSRCKRRKRRPWPLHHHIPQQIKEPVAHEEGDERGAEERGNARAEGCVAA